MTTPLIRSGVAPLEVVGDGRTVIGMVVPFDRVAEVDDGFGLYNESFDPHAFDKVMRSEPRWVRLHLEHGGPWVGRGERWIPTDAGLSMALRLDDTADGAAAAFKLRDGQLPGFSVGFIPGRTVTRMVEGRPVEVRMTVKTLHHVAVTPTPAFAEAQVTAIRSAPSVDRVSLWQAWLDNQSG